MSKFLCTVALFLVTVKANDDEPFHQEGAFNWETAHKSVSTPNIKTPDDYTASQIFMLTTQGTRTPRSAFSKDLVSKLIKYKTKFTETATLGKEDIQAIKKWAPNIDNTDDKSLEKGHNEIKDLAIRIREAFPNLFNRQFDSDSYDVLTTPETRCVRTGQTFIQTVFKDETITDIPICDPTDILLMIENPKQADTKCEETETYRRNPIIELSGDSHVAGVVQRVADKMGIDATELDPEIITIMYELSAFEWSFDERAISPWHSLFCQEDLEIVKNADDIFWYYFTGYGNPFDAKHACPMAIRLEESFRKKINGNGHDGVFYFAHSINLLSLCVILGLGDGDIPLTLSNYKSMKNPNWRSSSYGPRVANFMAVLSEGYEKDYRVAFFFNEIITRIPLADGSRCTQCPWVDIQDKLTAFISDNDCVNFVDTNTVKDYKDTNPYWHFSTKTPYKLVSAKEISVPKDRKPIQIVSIIRHGTTSTTKYFFDEMLPLMENFKGKITEKARMTQTDIQAIMNWRQSVEFKASDKDMIQKGRDEIKELALRVRTAFPDFFEQSTDYEALAVGVQRCKDTGIIFLQTVYDNKNIADVPTCSDKDLFLMNSNIVKPENLGQPENVKFKNSEIVKNVVERVNVKMGCEGLGVYEVVSIIYEVCRYEKSFEEESTPPWCSVFSREDLEVLEYIDELHWTYHIGYGRPFNLQLACPMTIRLLETLEAKIYKTQGPAGWFYFVHRTNIMSLYVMLGLGKDDSPPTSSNYQGMKNRQWRTAKFSPWAANFMLVLFENANNDDYDVAFYFNENITSITLVDGSSCTVCPWAAVREKLRAYISDNDCVNFMIKNLPADKNGKTTTVSS